MYSNLVFNGTSRRQGLSTNLATRPATVVALPGTGVGAASTPVGRSATSVAGRGTGVGRPATRVGGGATSRVGSALADRERGTGWSAKADPTAANLPLFRDRGSTFHDRGRSVADPCPWHPAFDRGRSSDASSIHDLIRSPQPGSGRDRPWTMPGRPGPGWGRPWPSAGRPWPDVERARAGRGRGDGGRGPESGGQGR